MHESIITRKIKIPINNRTKKYWIEKGYKIIDDKYFEVNPKDLKKYSEYKVEVKCPICKKVRLVTWFVTQRKNFTGRCQKCNGKINKKYNVGDTIGVYKVIDISNRTRDNGTLFYICQCLKCGNILEIRSDALHPNRLCVKDINKQNSEKLIKWHKDKGHYIFSEHTDEENEEYVKTQHYYFYNSKIWKDLRNKILKNNPLCEKCNSKEDLHIHHLYNRKRFPLYSLNENLLRVLCRKCHALYHSSIEKGEETLTNYLKWVKGD